METAPLSIQSGGTPWQNYRTRSARQNFFLAGRGVLLAVMRMLIAALLLLGQSDEQILLLKTFRAEFVEIKPGDAVKHSYQIAKYEVPQNLWESVLGSNPSKWKGKRNSVEMLSFAE